MRRLSWKSCLIYVVLLLVLLVSFHLLQHQENVSPFFVLDKERSMESLSRHFESLECQFTPESRQRYQSVLESNSTILFTILLYNSESIFPHYMFQVLHLAHLLQERFHVSIYENGSKDRTRLYLEQMRDYLNHWNISNRIILEEKATDWRHGHRIEKLARMRNQVMSPLYEDVHSEDYLRKYDLIVSLNDIVFCASDILELLLQHEIQEAHMTCGMDFETLWGNHAFYDLWVSRTMVGDLLYNAFPEKPGSFKFENGLDLFWKDPIGKERASRGFPVQMYSCWNGAVVLDTRPFYEHPELQFRRSKEGECSESECTLLSKDLWHLGYGRIMVVPHVTFAYKFDDFTWAKSSESHIPFYSQQWNGSEDCQECLSLSKLNWTLEKPKYSICYPLESLGSYGADWQNPSWTLT